MDLLNVALQVLGPAALGGVIWLYAQIYDLKTDYALSKNNLSALQQESAQQIQADLPGRIIKLETTIPYVVKSIEEVKEMTKNVLDAQHRIEVNIAANRNTKTDA